MYWVFPAQPSLGLTEWFKKVKIFSKQQLIGGKNALLMSGVRGVWSNYFKLIE